jgi:hypothetical protein
VDLYIHCPLRLHGVVHRDNGKCSTRKGDEKCSEILIENLKRRGCLGEISLGGKIIIIAESGIRWRGVVKMLMKLNCFEFNKRRGTS